MVLAGSGTDADRPRRVAAAEVTELPRGLLVRPAGPGRGPAHELTFSDDLDGALADRYTIR